MILAPLGSDNEPGNTKVQNMEDRKADNDNDKAGSILETRVEVSPLRSAAASDGLAAFWNGSEQPSKRGIHAGNKQGLPSQDARGISAC